MTVFKLKKPDLSGLDIGEVRKKAGDTKEIVGFVNKTIRPEYLYWDTVRYLPRPEGFTAEEFWMIVKDFRQTSFSRVSSLIKDESGKYFTWDTRFWSPELSNMIDKNLGGSLFTSFRPDRRDSDIYFLKGAMEEAIASSQLEGANTTRKAGKRMLQEGRKPKDKNERMIFNNYIMMRRLRNDYKNRKLDLDLLLEMQTVLTEGTIEIEDIGVLRTDNDPVYVRDRSTDVIYHIPPKEEFLKDEIERFLAYANDELKDIDFIHPVAKAIMIHFWIGYLHPFNDGNGRLARALFYWYLLRNGYWVFEYLPISRIIKNSPAQYRDAYTYTEQDDLDLTYFVDYNIRKIFQAWTDWEIYMKRKRDENQLFETRIKSKYNLNDRQLQLLRYYFKNRGVSTSIKAHTQIYNVSRMTARKDLIRLKELGFTFSKKIGREVHYFSTDKINELLD